jgi:hypothetical protein
MNPAATSVAQVSGFWQANAALKDGPQSRWGERGSVTAGAIGRRARAFCSSDMGMQRASSPVLRIESSGPLRLSITGFRLACSHLRAEKCWELIDRRDAGG